MKFLKGRFDMKFWLFITAAFLLIQTPVIGNYFRLFNTVIHESGHAMIALLGGHIERITLLSDSEGMTFGSASSRPLAILISLAGYTFSSCICLCSFWLIRKEKYTRFIDLLLGILFLNIILWVRNPFGFTWLVVFTFGFLLLLINGSEFIIRHVLFFLASLLLVDTIKSSLEILFISFIQPQAAGDAANLAFLTTIVPAQAWGVLFFFQAIFMTFICYIKGFFRFQTDSHS